MGSSWAKSWSNSWGNSWGAIVTGGGGASAKKKKKQRGYANEIARLEASLAAFRAKKEKAKPRPVEKIKNQEKEYSIEEVGGVELFEEATVIQEAIHEAERLFLEEQISKIELEIFKKKQSEALEVILMAINIDRHIALHII